MFNTVFSSFTVKLVQGNENKNSAGLVMLNYNEQWIPVCDGGISDTEASVICKTFGYSYGKYQCCSAFLSYDMEPASKHIVNLQCPAGTSDIRSCTRDISDSCPSGKGLASVHCRADPFPNEGQFFFKDFEKDTL